MFLPETEIKEKNVQWTSNAVLGYNVVEEFVQKNPNTTTEVENPETSVFRTRTVSVQGPVLKGLTVKNTAPANRLEL